VRLRPPDPPGSLFAAGLHLAGLSAFAVAQPLFDLLSRNAEFFAVRGSSRWDVILFAIGLVVLPPLALLGLEALAGLVHQRAATALHLLFVGGLAGLFVLQAIRGAEASSSVLFAVSAAAGAGAAALYALVRPARMLASVLGVAPVVFAGLFLFTAPVSRLVLESAPEPRLAEVPSNAPVVMVVFDELPTVSLLRADGEIDSERYPNFAHLAETATWYRNATTVHEWTTGAVPALLSGRWPEDDALPLYLDHPDNLFTLLGGAYELRVFESQTHLCPGQLCDADREPLAGRVGSLLSDLSIVYGHLVLPEDTADRLPSISTEWQNFGADGPAVRLQEGPSQPGRRPAAYTGRAEEVEEFVAALEPSDRPTLSFLHVLLPHHPWEYLPNGKIYAADLGFQPGMVNERWTGDRDLAIQSYQRHLLQVGYTDLALGRILDRLEETGLYDESLVVVAADHGVSFRPHGERRRIHAGNMEEIAFVPLFVKGPRQASGRVVDENVRLIDVVPTIAELLGIQLPWQADGVSALGAGRREEPDVVVHTSSGEIVVGDPSALAERREHVLEQQVRLFGEGNEPPGLYAIGPRPELLGRRAESLTVAVADGMTFESYGDKTYDPDSQFAPVRVYGRLRGAEGGRDVAVAVNGRVAAVTRSFEHDGETLVSAVVPEESLQPGENTVRVYLVDGPNGAAVLREVAPAA
jgi:Sulfatase